MIIHFIRSGDTYQSIAMQINLENPLYIKEFHNQHCVREDYIFEDLVPGKKLLLPSFRHVQNFNAKNDAPFKSEERNPKLNFIPQNFDAQYKIIITESSAVDGKKKKSSFSYYFDFKWIKSEINYHVFHCRKKQFSNMNETKIGELANVSMEFLYPIEVCTNLNGEITEIKLLKETVENFPKIKERLIDRFPDQYAKIYIEELEFVVLNEDVFSKKMKEDLLMKNYFAPLRKKFNNGKSVFEISLENSLAEIEQTGILDKKNEEVILVQKLAKNNSNTDVFSGKYNLSAKNGMITSAEIKNSYLEYGVLYASEMKIDKM